MSRLIELAQQTADDLQVPLEDVLTVISYETGGTMNPLQRGPTTQWGQHRGLIQFGEPQAGQHGVDFSSPEAALESQLGHGKGMTRYMLSSGFVPGEHSGIDIYSTINAGSPGRYSASDANNGGAPGDVRDKWENQMHGHRKNARRQLGLSGGGSEYVKDGGKRGSDHAGLGDKWSRRRDDKEDERNHEGLMGKALGLNEGGFRDKVRGALGISDDTGEGISNMGVALAGLGDF